MPADASGAPPHSLEQRVAEEILDKNFEAFSKKHYDRILERLEIDEEALEGSHRADRAPEPQAGQHHARDRQTGRRRSSPISR
jgi:hypothetical protein